MEKKHAKILMSLLLLLLLLTGCGRISDGDYAASVSLKGGSGKASIDSPCRVSVKNGKISAHIRWSSPYYDYMIVDGQKYTPVNADGNSEFEIPIEFEKEMQVQADTIAMSEPHLIDYTLYFTRDSEAASTETLIDEGSSHDPDSLEAPDISGLNYLSTDTNDYAVCYAMHRYSDGYAVISVDDGRDYLIVPADRAVPTGISDDIVVLKQPLDKIYLAASAAMCHFDSISAVDNISLSGIEADKWYIEKAKEKMRSGDIVYGGKYSAPDYEMMLERDIDLAIESTMILHTPKVKEKLEQLGIPVFIDRSSYEDSPMGRCEWVKIYGLLTSEEKQADKYFEKEKEYAVASDDSVRSDKNVVFFSVNSNHQIVTRKKNDYMAKMIEMAGGRYLSPKDADEGSSSSQLTISMEAFFDYASDADILIYNTAIEDAPDSIEKLAEMEVAFKDFKAIKQGKVWYTDKSLYQFSNKSGTIIENLHEMIGNEAENTEFFHKLD